MRGYVERMEWLEKFSDEPVSYDDIMESYRQEADEVKNRLKYEGK